jgi:hypothetical protein
MLIPFPETFDELVSKTLIISFNKNK